MGSERKRHSQRDWTEKYRLHRLESAVRVLFLCIVRVLQKVALDEAKYAGISKEVRSKS